MNMISSIMSVCVENKSDRAAHAGIYNRDGRGGIFGNPGFGKRIATCGKECCDAGNKDCYEGSLETSFFWVDCDTDNRPTKGYGQLIVCCSNCLITFCGRDTITCTTEAKPDVLIATYACRL
ncbi:unnamed protein product [Didymodactylos carnosus]|uniref:Uncharacterized protein n=1 Tax=Didymodactylos carnosus TaxID=1234261 RepID=A0A815MTC6_9BILA|nr:unnamed protein product [Didymodactylos carnosus]CAF4307358.1 unnamed protein product [Didymodactylos carnosus]